MDEKITMTRTLPGLDLLSTGGAATTHKFLRGQRIGLLTNQTGCTLEGTPALAALRALNIKVTALFSPEHGPAGTCEGVVESGSTQDGLPIHSLYGSTRRPNAEMLGAIDVLICDLQDVGARFYTYASTLAYAMEECALHHKSVVVLDRPNPLGGEIIEGPSLEDDCRSFVGHLRVPVRHGLTLGELALLHCEDMELDLDLHIVQVEGWKRTQRWPETNLPWRRPSPNLPDYRSAAWYPGTCLLEFSGVSVGRGTAAPFQIIGAPWFDTEAVLRVAKAWPLQILQDITLEPLAFTPAHAVHAGEPCRGFRFYTTSDATDGSQRRVDLGLALLSTLHYTHPEEFGEEKLRAALPLLGSPAVLQTLLDNDIETALALARADDEAFRARRESVLLYA
jgi:uncharacterized protein YbbC (DUF1343 family)